MLYIVIAASILGAIIVGVLFTLLAKPNVDEKIR